MTEGAVKQNIVSTSQIVHGDRVRAFIHFSTFLRAGSNEVVLCNLLQGFELVGNSWPSTFRHPERQRGTLLTDRRCSSRRSGGGEKVPPLRYAQARGEGDRGPTRSPPAPSGSPPPAPPASTAPPRPSLPALAAAQSAPAP